MRIIFLTIAMFLSFCFSKGFAKEAKVTNNTMYKEIIDKAEKEDWRMVCGDESQDHNNVYQNYFFSSKQKKLLLKDKKLQLKEFDLVLSRKGDKAAFWLKEEDSNIALYIVNSDGTHQTQILRIAAGGGIAWSPDGKNIAFLISDNVQKISLNVVNIDTKTVSKVLVD